VDADRFSIRVSFQSHLFLAVLLPERFRGGFAFGAGANADLSRKESFNATNMCLPFQFVKEV
jgi:hypothetical protein